MHGEPAQVFQQQFQLGDTAAAEMAAVSQPSGAVSDDGDMATAQITAVMMGSGELLSALIEQDHGRRNGISRTAGYALADSDGQTPLMAAANAGRVHMLEDLLATYPESIDAEHDFGYTAFRLACDSGHDECIKALMIAGCNTMVEERPARMDEELRVDSTDGQEYSRDEFIQEYGGTIEWEAAERKTAWQPATHPLIDNFGTQHVDKDEDPARPPPEPARPPDDTDMAPYAFGGPGPAPQQVPQTWSQSATVADSATFLVAELEGTEPSTLSRGSSAGGSRQMETSPELAYAAGCNDMRGANRAARDETNNCNVVAELNRENEAGARRRAQYGEELCLGPPSSSRGLGGLLLLWLAMATQKKRVSYYYDPDIGNFYYGQVGERTPARSRAVLPLPLRPPSTRVWVGPTRGPAWVLALHTLSGAALCLAVCAGASDEAAPHPGRPPPHRGTCAPRVPAQACDSSSPALRAPAFFFVARRRTICTARARASPA